MAISAAVSLAVRAPALAASKPTCTAPLALVVAGATVVVVPVQVDAMELAPGKPGRARWVKAHPIPVAIRLRIGANVSARAAVVGIPAQICARPVAVDGPRAAVVDAPAVDAGGYFIDASTRPTVVETGAAVVDVVVGVGAVGAAAVLRGRAAAVAAAASTEVSARLGTRP